MECLPIQSTIYIPENKVSAWVSKKGQNVKKDRSKEFQGQWVVDGYTLDKRKESTEIWIFYDSDDKEIDRRVLENNPLQGKWGYAPGVNPRKAEIKDMWFFPPKSAKCKIPKGVQEYNHQGTWIKPIFKRDFSQLDSNTSGFMTVSGNMKIRKGEKHSIAGKWNMLGFNDDVVRGKKKNKTDDDDKNRSFEIFVRKVNGVTFPISVIPGNKIRDCKKKIHSKKRIPIEDQRLSFKDVPLKDEKTVVGSGIRNGDTIDLGPMIIYVRTRRGKKFTFEVDQEEAIEDVKTMVEKREGTPADEQRLYFKNVKLKNGKNLSDYKVRHKNTLDLGPMVIFVKPNDDRPKIELDVEPTDTLKSVKTKVKTRLNIPVSEQRLTFEEEEMLKDSRDLQGYNVQHLDTLFMLGDNKKNENTPGMVIFVIKEWDNHKFKLRTEPTNTILEIKHMIEASEDIPVSEQRLTFKKKSVYNTKTLEESKIKNRSILHLGKPRDTKKILAPDTVDIELPDKSKISIPVTPSHTFADIKDEIEKKNGIPKDKQRIFFMDNDDEPDDNLPVFNPDMSAPKPIGLEILPDPEPIEVKTPDGRSFYLDFDPENDTVDDLKNKVAKLAGLPVKDFELLDPDDEIIDDDDNMPKQDVLLNVAPNIDVVLPDKSKVRVTMLPKMTVDDLQDVVEEKIGKPTTGPRFFFFDNEGNELDGTTPVQKADIQPGEVLEMRPPPPPPKEEIPVKLPDGRSFYLDFDPENDTIEDLKNKVAKLAGLPVKDFELLDPEDEIMDDDNYIPSRSNVMLNVAPNVDVVLPDKSKVRVTMLPKMTVDDLKDVVEEKVGKPSAGPRFFFFDNEGNELDGSTPIQKADIQPGSKLEMRPPPPPPKEEIPVKLPDGRSFYLDFDPENDTVNDLRKKAAKLAGIPVKDLHFLDEDDEIVDDDNFVPSRGDVMLNVAPQVDILLPDKSKVRVTMLPKMTVDDLKDVVEEKVGKPSAGPRFFFFDNEGNELDGSAPITKKGIQPGSVLEMRPPPAPPEEEKVTVRLPDGRSFYFDFDPETESNDDLKSKISRTFGVPVKDLPPLMLDDEELDDDDDHRPSKGDILDFEPPEIEVELPNKSKVKLVILPTQTIGEVKDVVEELTGVKRADQRIFYFDSPDEEVDDDVMFRKTKIQPGTPLKIFPRGGKKPKEIKVKDPSGRMFHFVIEPEETAHDVKKRIREKVGFPVGCFKLEDGVWDDSDDDIPLDTGRLARDGGVLEIDHPEIEVALPNSKKIKIKILPAMTMRDIKDIIEIEAPELSTGNGDRQRMFFFDDKEELDDDTPFDKLKFEHGQKLEMRSMMIKVEHWDGRTFELDVQSDWYIDDIRDKISQLAKMAPEKQNFSFNDDVVQEELSLIKQGIVHNSTLVLVKMLIYVSVPSKKKPLRFTVKESDTVSAIKRKAVKKIKKSKTASSKNYCLMSGGQELANKDTVRKCNIQHEDKLTLEEFKVRIMHWEGDMINLDGIERTSTIAFVKKQIQKSEGIPIDDLVISTDGRCLDDSKTLDEEKVKHRTTLVLEPPDADLDMERAEKRNVRTSKLKKFKMTGDEFDEIMPVMPDWKRRIFFFDYDNDFDAYIELIIMDWRGDKFTLEKILLKRKVTEIKRMIHKRQGIKRNKQILKFNGKVLKDKRTLLDQGVGHRSILVLESPEKNTIAAPKVERLNTASLFTTMPTKFVTNITIHVQHWNGDTFDLSPNPNDYIDDIKDSIFDLKGISQEHLRISFNDQPTDDAMNLEEHGIVNGSILYLEPMQIKVELPTWKKPISLNVEMNETIAQVKKRIGKKLRRPLDSLFVMFGGNELENSQTLEDCGIDHGDQVRIESFEVIIMHWSGERFSVNDGLMPKSSTYDLKESIARLQSIPIEQQTLIVKGKTLNDFLRLKDQGVHHRSILMLDPPDERTRTPVKEKVKLSLSLDKEDEDADHSQGSGLSPESLSTPGIDKIYFGNLGERSSEFSLSDDILSSRSVSTRSTTSKTTSIGSTSSRSKKKSSKEKKEKKTKGTREKPKRSKSEKSTSSRKSQKSTSSTKSLKRKKDSKKKKTTVE